MRREFCFVNFACYSGGNYRGGIFIPYVVLHDENGTNPALFAAYNGGKVRIIQFASFYVHTHTSFGNRTKLLITLYVKKAVAVRISRVLRYKVSPVFRVFIQKKRRSVF